MRVKTMAVATLLAVVFGYAVLQVIPWPGTDPREMAKPRKYKPQPGRAVVVLQLCWSPAAQAQLDVGWALGGGGSSDRVGVPLTCATPWQRRAVLDPGANVLLGWTLLRGPVSRFQYRITVNNRARIQGSETANTRMFGCVVGKPPCEIP